MASLKDIATPLGVNISTVSRALNDSHEISKATKQLIHEKARELNYMPNLAARTLSGKSTKSIGLIIPEVKSVRMTNLCQINNLLDELSIVAIRKSKRSGPVYVISNSIDNGLTIIFSHLKLLGNEQYLPPVAPESITPKKVSEVIIRTINIIVAKTVNIRSIR